MGRSETASLRRAAQGWVRALNTKGERAVVDAVLAPRGVVWRYVADEPDTPPQRIAGPSVVSRWLSSAPGKARFSLVPRSLEPDPEHAARGSVRYRVKVGAFENFGTWALELAKDGRVKALHHRPDPLPERWRVGG